MIEATVVGRLTRDPEQRPAGQYNVTNFTVASDSTRKNKDGNYDTTFVRCTVFGRRGEVIMNSFQKGQPIIVSGELVNSTWTDKQGQNRQSTELNVSSFSHVPRDKFQGQANQQGQQSEYIQESVPQQPSQPQQESKTEISDDDLPF